MKKRSNIFVLCIVLLAYVFYPPSLGTADRNSFKGDKKFSLGGSRLADLPKVVRQKITEHMRRAEYQVSRSKKRLSSGKTSAYRAFNPNQNLTVCFTERGVHLIPNGRAEPAWHLEMTLSGYGYDGAMEPVHSVGLDAIEVSGNRVEYRRGVLTEWYVNDERGLEQGVTIREPPAGKSTSPLLVEWALSSSLVARAEQGRVAITFGKTDPILHYTGLMAWDAAGRSLPADLALRRTGPDDCVARISYVVDDTGASYPVTIDPVFTQAKKLRPAGSAEDWFGYSVSISGDKAVVGAPGDGENQGAAYIFYRDQGGANNWSQVKKIYGSQADDFFGASVSINGDTLVVGAFGQGSVGSPFAGEAYIFERNQGGTDNWGYVQTLRASDRVAYQYFGYSVSISGDTLVVGAYGRSDSFGSAYVFQRQPLAWNEVQKITPTDAALGDRFGWCVSISGDRVVVGSPYDDDNGDSSGAAYIFYRDQGGSDNWGQVRKITPADGFFDDGFGWSVSIGGNKVVIGSPYDDDNGEDSGSAYVFYRNRGGADNWGRVKKITPGDGQTGDHFGFSISINGDTAVVGARHDDDNGEDSGSGYIFYRDRNGDNNWGQVRKITPSNGSSGDEFGSSVSISGGTALVGAYLDDDGVDDSGSAYVFYRDWGGAANWGQVRKTFPSGGGLHHSFAFSVSVSGDTVVVGAPYAYEGGYLSGAAYIFSRDRGGTDNWGQVRKIVPGGLFGNFGLSVSISGHTVVVGDPYDDDGGQDSGAAYIFYRNRGGTDNWGQVRKIFANDADVDDLFGWSVSISGDTVVIGAPFDEENGDTSGSAYVFYRDQGGADSWGHVAKILPDDGSAGDRFGWSVSVSDRTAVIGAPYDQDNGLLSGSAYIFSRTGQSQYNWHQLAKITPNQGAPGDEFGDSVSVSGDAVAIGARGDDDNGNDAGAAYVYYRQYSGQKWPQVRKITPTGGSVGDWFGDSVSISGDWLVVGAPYNDDNGGDSGTAYVFCRTRGGLDNWGQVRKILTNDGEAKDLFGWSASISDGTVVIGAPYDDDNGEDSGSAYIFRKGPLFPWLILLLLGN